MFRKNLQGKGNNRVRGSNRVGVRHTLGSDLVFIQIMSSADFHIFLANEFPHYLSAL